MTSLCILLFDPPAAQRDPPCVEGAILSSTSDPTLRVCVGGVWQAVLPEQPSAIVYDAVGDLRIYEADDGTWSYIAPVEGGACLPVDGKEYTIARWTERQCP